MTPEEARRLKELFDVDPFAPADRVRLYREISKVFGDIEARLVRESHGWYETPWNGDRP